MKTGRHGTEKLDWSRIQLHMKDEYRKTMHKSLKITSNSEAPPPIHVSRRYLQPHRDVVEDLPHCALHQFRGPHFSIAHAQPSQPAVAPPRRRSTTTHQSSNNAQYHLSQHSHRVTPCQYHSISMSNHVNIHVNPCQSMSKSRWTSMDIQHWHRHLLHQLQPWLRTKDSSKKDHSWKCHDSLRRSLERCGQQLRHEKDISGMQVPPGRPLAKECSEILEIIVELRWRKTEMFSSCWCAIPIFRESIRPIQAATRLSQRRSHSKSPAAFGGWRPNPKSFSCLERPVSP